MSDKINPGQPISPPPDFPIVWENPVDAKLTWRHDSHGTVPMAPLSGSVGTVVMRGFNAAFIQLGLPMQVRTLRINGYSYATRELANKSPRFMQKTMGLVNRVAPSLGKRIMGRAMSNMSEQLLNQLQPTLARLDTYWQDELLPQNRQHLAYFESCDLRGLSLTQLRRHLAEGLKRTERLGELHALAGIPAVMAMSLFEEFYQELFPKATSLEALRLIQGMDSQTVSGDRALWALSRLALTMPTVKQLLVENEPELVMTTLEQSDEGQRFLAELQTYLDEYGQRLNVFADLTEPSWVEEPVTAVACLRSYLNQPDANPEALQAHLTAEREQAIAAARRQLAGQPAEIITKFETLLRAAQAGAAVKEDNHWMLQRLFYQMRRLALVLGQRLCEAGLLPAAADVFYLSAEELLAGTAASATLIEERKAAKSHFSRITPPPMLGTAPLFEPPDIGPFRRAMQKADSAAPKGRGDDAQILRGQAASAGTVRGVARVITTLAEANKLRSGEVLVTRATTPPWTPLFGIATAVVTDTGGVLSHCAVVAREYGIPAVVGTATATQRLQDGQLLEVDGSAGTVRILSTPSM